VRAPGIRFEDLPRIDLVLVSHNHYDHLDIPTLERLWARDRPAIVTGLGNDTILKKAGIPSRSGDWGETIGIFAGCPPTARCAPRAQVRIERVHHWSSRWGTDRNRALWSGFTIKLPGGNVFFAGDTGFGGGSWADEAARQGPIRLAILPIGAYLPREIMQSNHVDPDESLAVFERLRPTMALGMHWGTFQLTFEPIGDPPRRLAAALRARGVDPRRFVATEVGRTFSVPGLEVPGRAGEAPPAVSGSARASPGSMSRRR
jgi:L-ascorbate metabolism protein UlaG (beta-lactamase superfamily)